MQKYILAVSPDAKLLTQMQSHLQESGRFAITCVSDSREALLSMNSQEFDLAILDGEINDMPFVPLTRELVGLSPNLKLLVFPPQNNPHHPALTGLIANGFLNKPFFGPEISEKIAKALSDKTKPSDITQSEVEDITRDWVQNPELGAKQTEQLLASTTALSGLLLLRGQVMASSGVLSQESGSNIINYLNRYWTNVQSGELFRYLTMENEASSYIIYAAPLIKETAIALVYNAQKSIQDIRSEVSRLRKAFVERYSTTGELRHDFGFQSVEQSAATPGSTEIPPSSRLNTNRLGGRVGPVSIPRDDQEEEGVQEGLSEQEIQNLNQMLADMPAPDPEAEIPVFEETPSTARNEWAPIMDAGTLDEETSPAPASGTLDIKGAVGTEPEYGKAEETSEISVAEEVQPERTEEFPNFDFVLPWEKETGSTPAEVDDLYTVPATAQPAYANEKDEDDTSPMRAAHPRVLVPCTFLLFPADSGQFITRDLAALCNKNLPGILSEFGWQLNAISIRPLYLQWSADIPPFCGVSERLSDIRLQLNTLLFTANPGLLQANPGGDFWMPGYFALTGSTPPSNRMINDFIALYRQVEPQMHTP